MADNVVTTVISLKGKQKLYGSSLEKEEAMDLVYVGRTFKYRGWNLTGSPFQNPYLELPAYEKYIRAKIGSNPKLYDELMQLRGKNLACWCVTKSNLYQCHAVILKKIIEE